MANEIFEIIKILLKILKELFYYLFRGEYILTNFSIVVMSKASLIKPLLQSIKNNNKNLHISLNILARFIDDQLDINDEFRKEFHRIVKNSSMYYQVIVKDTNLIVNVKFSNEKISFLNDFNGLNESYTPLKLDKNSVISILTGKESFTTLYMKGAIEIKGGLSEAIKIRNALNLFLQLI